MQCNFPGLRQEIFFQFVVDTLGQPPFTPFLTSISSLILKSTKKIQKPVFFNKFLSVPSFFTLSQFLGEVNIFIFSLYLVMIKVSFFKVICLSKVIKLHGLQLYRKQKTHTFYITLVIHFSTKHS